MARFFGRYEHSLDPKGRVILPAKFRTAFEQGGFLTQYHDRCLALWTPDEFEKQMRQMQQAQDEGREQRNLARLWASGSAEVDVDKQGRMPIPQHLREFGRLDGDVLVMGAIDRVELWSPAQWQAKVEPSEGLLTDDDVTQEEV
jgi:MraZ protein